jgi:Peptidase family S41
MNHRRWRLGIDAAFVATILLTFAKPFVGMAVASTNAPYDPKPWLDDLAQMRSAFSGKYANFEWALFEREIDLSALFADARKRIDAAGTDAAARAAFDRLVRRLGDGHVELDWPDGAAQSKGPPLPCADYDAARAAQPLAAFAKGYVPIVTAQSGVFPAGLLTTGKHRVGVIKIALFSPTAFPVLCKEALAALSISADKPCDDQCENKVDAWAQARLNADFIAQLENLEHAKVDTLLVDIAGNGGGTEWAEAVARMLTPIRLKSAPMGFVRGPHWVQRFGETEAKLRRAAEDASRDDRAMLLKFAGEAAAKKAVAATLCDSAPFWSGKRPPCAWLGKGFYATGPLESADPRALKGKPWAAEVFTPMKYSYAEGLWRGPLIVLVDAGSGSASEEFAAELQDNHAAVIIGEPTYGVGCGHTDGGTPTTLSHSRAILLVPDCVRFRADGRNEAAGVMPDVLVGFRRPDGPHLRAAAFLARLPDALDYSRCSVARSRC